MSTQHNDGGPAFPVNYSNEADGPTVMPTPGMSLRDYFAAHALTGLIRMRCNLKDRDEPLSAENALVNGVGSKIPRHSDVDGRPLTFASDIASDAYCIADAMLRARDAK